MEGTTTGTTRDNKRFLAGLGTNLFYHEPLARRSQFARICSSQGSERKERNDNRNNKKQHRTTKGVPRIAREKRLSKVVKGCHKLSWLS